MRCFFLAPFRINVEGASRCLSHRENLWDLLEKTTAEKRYLRTWFLE